MTASALAPEIVAAIDDLDVAARVVVEGMRAGAHRSPFLGAGGEFQQYRPYRAGDDLRHLDWKLYARSDRLFTRQFRETTDFAVQIVIDPSASMAYPPEGLSKLRYAKILAASLAYLVIGDGNSAGIATYDARGFTYVPARSGAVHRRLVVAHIDAMQSVPSWNAVDAVRHAAELLKRRGMLIVISDFYDDEAATLLELRTAVQRGHDVVMIQLLSSDERTFRLGRDVELEDLESNARRNIDVAAVGAEYQRRLDAFLAQCRADAMSGGIAYALMTTDTPPADALRDLLMRRRG